MKDRNISDDQLEPLLREQEPYISDNGFTRQVLEMLPAPIISPVWLKPIVLTVAATTGSILSLAFLPVSIEEILYRMGSIVAWMEYVDYRTFTDKLLQILIPVAVISTTASLSLLFASSESR